MKKRVIRFVLLFVTILNLFSDISFALSNIYSSNEYYEVNNIIEKLRSHIHNKCRQPNQPDEKSKVMLMVVKDIDLKSDDRYQFLHDTLQNDFLDNEIFDVYIRNSGQIIIPEKTVQYSKDDETKYSDKDIDFKNKLSNLGVKHLSIINEEKNVVIPSQYYNDIVNCMARMYNKYFYLTDKYINHVSNTLCSSLEIDEIKNERKAIGEFIGEGDKIILSPNLFSMFDIDKQDYTKKLIEYAINHEMGHSIELNLCKKIFKDLNLNNISQRGLEQLAELYFCSGETEVSNRIIDSVLTKMNAPIGLEERKNFIKENLSDYANKNPSEFFAEAIAYGAWKDLSCNKYISTLVEEEIKNIVNEKGDIYLKLKEDALNFIKNNIK